LQKKKKKELCPWNAIFLHWHRLYCNNSQKRFLFNTRILDAADDLSRVREFLSKEVCSGWDFTTELKASHLAFLLSSNGSCSSQVRQALSPEKGGLLVVMEGNDIQVRIIYSH
jgi:hypothetical protein